MRLIGDPVRGVAGADLEAAVGALRERVTLQSVTRTKGTGGFATDTPETEVTVPAEVVPVAGTEPYEAAAQRGQTRYRVRIRFRSDVRALWLVVWRDVTLQILEAPISDAKRRFLWLSCGAVEA